MYQRLRSPRSVAPLGFGCVAFLGCVAVLIVTALGGCVHVDLEEQAVAVQVVRSLDDVAQCKKMGTIGTSTKASVGLIDRSEEDVAIELERMARNRAGRLAANTVVPLGPVDENGARQFGAYACPD